MPVSSSAASKKRSRSQSKATSQSVTATHSQVEEDNESMAEVSSISSAIMRRQRVHQYANEQVMRRLSSSGSSFADLETNDDPLRIFREPEELDDEDASPGAPVPENRPDWKN